MTAAPINEYSMMNGNRYGALSCTMVPIIFILSHVAGSISVSFEDIRACGKIAVRLLLFPNSVFDASFKIEFAESAIIEFDTSPAIVFEVSSMTRSEKIQYV